MPTAEGYALQATGAYLRRCLLGDWGEVERVGEGRGDSDFLARAKRAKAQSTSTIPPENAKIKTMNPLDITIFRSINNLSDLYPFLNSIMIFFAEYSLYLLALYLILSWFLGPNKSKNRLTLLSCVIAFAGSFLVGKLVGHFITHPQPFVTLDHVHQLIHHGINNSFPSDHTILFFSIAFTLLFFNKGRKGLIAIIFASIVAISRIWVGVHFPSDILASIIISFFIAYLVYLFAIQNKLLTRVIAFYNQQETKFISRLKQNKTR